MKLFIKENGKWGSEGIEILDLKLVHDEELNSKNMVAFIPKTEEGSKAIEEILGSQRYYGFQSVKIVSDSGELTHEFHKREYGISLDEGPYFKISENGEVKRINAYMITFHKLEAYTYVIEASYEDKVIVRQNFWLPDEKLTDKVDIEDNYHLLTEHIKAFYNNMTKDGKAPTGFVKIRCLFIKDSREELIGFLGSSAESEVPITDIVCEKEGDQLNARIMSILTELSDYILIDTRKVSISVNTDNPEDSETFDFKAYSFKKVTEVNSFYTSGRELEDYLEIVLEDKKENKDLSKEILEAINYPGSGNIIFTSTAHGFSYMMIKEKFRAEVYEDKCSAKLLAKDAIILKISRIKK